MWLGQEVTSEMVVSPVYNMFLQDYSISHLVTFTGLNRPLLREKMCKYVCGPTDLFFLVREMDAGSSFGGQQCNRGSVSTATSQPKGSRVGIPWGGRAFSVRLPPTVQRSLSISPAMSWRLASSASGMVGWMLVFEPCPIPGLSGYEEAWCEWLCVPVQRPKTTTLVCICQVEHPCKGHSCMQSRWDLQMSELSTLDLLFVLNMEVLVNIIFCWERAA